MGQPKVDENKLLKFYLDQIDRQPEFKDITLNQGLLIAELVTTYYKEALTVGYKAGYDEAMQKIAQSSDER